MGDNKILTEIVPANRVIKRRKLAIEGSSVIVSKGKRGRGGRPASKATFNEDSIIYYHQGKWPFKRLKQKLMLREGSQECMTFEKDKVKGLSDKDIEHLFDVSAITKAGATVTKLEVPMYFVILTFVGIILMVINLIFTFRLGAYFGL